MATPDLDALFGAQQQYLPLLVASGVFVLGCITNFTNNRWSIAESAADAEMQQ